MITARQDVNLLVRHLINPPMFPVNALRPATSHVADERLRLADAGNGSVCVSGFSRITRKAYFRS